VHQHASLLSSAFLDLFQSMVFATSSILNLVNRRELSMTLNWIAMFMLFSAISFSSYHFSMFKASFGYSEAQLRPQLWPQWAYLVFPYPLG